MTTASVAAATEIAGRLTQREKVGILLRRRGTVTNAELNQICFRYAARIHELRARGWVITTQKVRGSLVSFTLVEAGA